MNVKDMTFPAEVFEDAKLILMEWLVLVEKDDHQNKPQRTGQFL